MCVEVGRVRVDEARDPFGKPKQNILSLHFILSQY